MWVRHSKFQFQQANSAVPPYTPYKITPEAYCVHSSPSFDLKSQIHIIASYMSSSADQMAVCAGESQPVRHSLTRLEQMSQMQSLPDLRIAGKEEFRRSRIRMD